MRTGLAIALAALAVLGACQVLYYATTNTLLQVLVPQEMVARYFGPQGGLRAIVLASIAGILTPGGPMVTVPFMVALANSGMALPPLVAYMTSWSLFGMQRIIAWEAPLMGWQFVVVRVIPSLAFPVMAGWLVAVFYRE